MGNSHNSDEDGDEDAEMQEEDEGRDNGVLGGGGVRASSSMAPPSAGGNPHQQHLLRQRNPLLKAQKEFMESMDDKVRNHFFSDDIVSADARADVWARQADLGEDMINRYSWATPDDRALKILKHFSPIVEMGCGRNAYWANMMKAAGIDVVAYDSNPADGGLILDGQQEDEEGKDGKANGGDDGNGDGDGSPPSKKKMKLTHSEDAAETSPRANGGRTTSKQPSSGGGTTVEVRTGGPEVLADDSIAHRTLFLCYPDEEFLEDQEGEGEEGHNHQKDNDDDDEDDENDVDRAFSSLGRASLSHYQGQYVIHVGELYGDTLASQQAPFGRSSSPEFQCQLASNYHCILRVRLRHHWLHVRDTISVWKRSAKCSMVFADDDENNTTAAAGRRGDKGEEEEGVDLEDDEDTEEYKYIPPEEQLPTDIAAPCVQHLL